MCIRDRLYLGRCRRNDYTSSPCAHETSPGPVSYTHLDVYKRQQSALMIFFRGERLGEMCDCTDKKNGTATKKCPGVDKVVVQYKITSL